MKQSNPKIFAFIPVISGIMLTVLQFRKLKSQPDILIAGGQWGLNPMKHYTQKELEALLPKIDELNKKFGCDQ